MITKNNEILLKQKNEWNKVKSWKEGFNDHRNTSRYVQKIHTEPVMERTISGKREVPDKVIVSKAAFQKVEKTVNHARQAQWIAESELQEERGENNRLKKELMDERKQSNYWRDAWSELNDKVENSLEPIIKRLEKFKDWTLDQFEKVGQKRESVINSFEQKVNAEELEQQRKINKWYRDDFDIER